MTTAPTFDLTPFLSRDEGQHVDRKSMFEGEQGKKRPRDRRKVRDQVAERAWGVRAPALAARPRAAGSARGRAEQRLRAGAESAAPARYAEAGTGCAGLPTKDTQGVRPDAQGLDPDAQGLEPGTQGSAPDVTSLIATLPGDLWPLVTEGKLERRYPDNPTHPLQAYRAVRAGAAP